MNVSECTSIYELRRRKNELLRRMTEIIKNSKGQRFNLGPGTFAYESYSSELKEVDQRLWDLEHKDSIEVIEEILPYIVRYCEDKAIWDKLGSYGDFYYKIKEYLKHKTV